MKPGSCMARPPCLMLSTVIEAEMIGMWLSRQVWIMAEATSKRLSIVSASILTSESLPMPTAESSAEPIEPRPPE